MTFDPMPKAKGRIVKPKRRFGSVDPSEPESDSRDPLDGRNLPAPRPRINPDQFRSTPVPQKPPLDGRNLPKPSPRIRKPPIKMPTFHEKPVDGRNLPKPGPRINPDQFRSIPYKPRRPIDMPRVRPDKMPSAEGSELLSFNNIMKMRAKAMAAKGMKPEGSKGKRRPGGSPSPQAMMRRMSKKTQPGADPRIFLQKLPPEIANLAARYGRI